ncbi:SsrA-binding protein SmpB [Buchnera aphidicola (Taiwanaphis decaspermi)]|uniref:SsrA-binding protein SmpB n=1 Tax=Buchnera aphidicola TaxID=9 RepID=UPI0031B82538
MKKKYNVILINKKSAYNYFIIEKIESGVVLKGWEVKSLRKKQININGSYVSFYDNEAYLVNSSIEPLKYVYNNNIILKEKTRNRKLLLHRQEINYLKNKVNKMRLTIIIISIYWIKNLCKIRLGLAKGKKKYDKRLLDKKKQWDKNKKLLR